MKRLAFFTLEGLLEQGPHEVWVTLGTFPTAEAARHAQATQPITRPGISKKRVVPLFRISEEPAASDCLRLHSATISNTLPGAAEESVTVA